ncbi:SE1832 family protein [Bacillaceae bacterium W0354]
MTKAELQSELEQLKMDYIRIQGDLEKLESVGGRTSPLENTLKQMEEDMAVLRKKISEAQE